MDADGGVIRYKNVRRPKDEADRRYLRQLAGVMLARACEASWRHKAQTFIAALAYARRSNERAVGP